MARIGPELQVGIGVLPDDTRAVILAIDEETIVLSELQAVEISAALREAVNQIRNGTHGIVPEGYHGPGR